MNHLTPEQALADIRAVRRDRADSHWFACACALADALESRKPRADSHWFACATIDELRTENANLRAERDSARSDAANVSGPLLDSISRLQAELDAYKTLDKSRQLLAEVAS
jgi:hypothetical protein